MAPVVSKATMIKALVVEDDPLIRMAACTTFAQAGFQVFEAADGEEGLMVLQENPSIGFVFTDISMPRMDGITMLARARELRPGLKTLVTSGHSEVPLEEAFLPKPYRLAALRDMAIRVLER